MLKKFLFTTIMFVLCFSASNASNKFFIEGGVGNRFINGDITYDLFSSTNLEGSVTDDNSVGWKSKTLTSINGTIGYQFSQKHISSISIQFYTWKPGYGSTYSIQFAEFIIMSDKGNMQSSSIVLEKNWYNQINIRATHNYYVHNNIFLIAGAEYASMKLEVGTDDVYEANTFGLIAGLGFEKSINSQMSLIANGNYVSSTYNGDEFDIKNLDVNIGGFELGLSLRYYLK